ncbi:MAG: diguanylate cyclase [Chloroflexota bacterium]
MNLLAQLEKQSQVSKIGMGLALIAAVGVVDFLTGYELAFSLFYVIPVAYATWLIGRRYGIAASIVSALVWFWVDVVSGNYYSQALIPIWNTLIRFSFFILFTLLLSVLKNSMEREKELARIDFLTGAINSRFFYELLQMEIDRLQRTKHSFTLVYFDVDNFKIVNDQFGHLTGDQVLQTVVSHARHHMRRTDVIARLGGDEFALLLPETGQESAHVVIEKLQSGLLAEMQQRNWKVTFSIGVLTCNAKLPNTDALVKMADELMYSVKRGGKNAIKYSSLETSFEQIEADPGLE